MKGLLVAVLSCVYVVMAIIGWSYASSLLRSENTTSVLIGLGISLALVTSLVVGVLWVVWFLTRKPPFLKW